jgi:uncharacterized protein (DUF1015 family)
MPGLLPFRGIRYAARAPVLSSLISPPYDCISAEELEVLAARNPHNVVHLILGKERPGDGAEENKYVRSARWFREWLDKGILKQDPRPAIYPLEQTFEAPGGRQLTRRGLIAAIRLHDFKDGVIVPHESTVPATKANLLELLKNAGANLSPILGLYPDPRNEAIGALAAAVAVDPVAEADSDDRVHHRLWRVEDPHVIAAVQRVLADRRVLIADGHHRYEAALAYRDFVDFRMPGLSPDGGHRYILMFLCSMSDPGMLIYPMHRLVGMPDLDLLGFLASLERFFTVETLLEDVRRPAGRAWAISRLAEHLGKSTAFVLVSASDRKARILTLRDDVDLGEVGFPKSENLRALDVTVLHSLVFRALLRLSPDSEEQAVRFVKDAGEAVTRVLSGETTFAFLVNPTPMWQVQAVGEAGETMPQKSTSFHPQIPSGLVFRKIDPNGPA